MLIKSQEKRARNKDEKKKGGVGAKVKVKNPLGFPNERKVVLYHQFF